MEGMNRNECEDYFNLLKQALEQNELMNKPGSIYTVDESGLQLSNEPGFVVDAKGSEAYVRQSTESGETISVIACANAEGVFLPPFCILKGVKKQEVWKENMPTEAVIEMRRESACVDEHIFMKWFRNHFLPRKPPGKCLLILDDHGSHTNSADILECARDSNVILLYLPSHTTQYLQPLDRSFFQPLQAYYRSAASEWENAYPGKKLESHHFVQLLGQAWTKSATFEAGITGFKACGVYPYKPSAIPDCAFMITSSQESNQHFEDHNEMLPEMTQTSTSTCGITTPNISVQ